MIWQLCQCPFFAGISNGNLSFLLPEPLRILLRSLERGTAITSVPMTPKGGWTTLAVSPATMKPQTSMNSLPGWPTAVLASAFLAMSARRRKATSKTAVHQPTATRMVWPRPWSAPVCWTRRETNLRITKSTTHGLPLPSWLSFLLTSTVFLFLPQRWFNLHF